MTEEDCHGRAPAEGRHARQALVQNASERVDVSRAANGSPLDLLRSRVIDRAREAAGPGELVLGETPAQTEVGEIRPTRVVDEEVGGLDVSVHEPFRVRGIERVGDGRKQRERPGRLEGSPVLEHLPEVATLDVAHRDVEPTVDLPCIEDRND